MVVGVARDLRVIYKVAWALEESVASNARAVVALNVSLRDVMAQGMCFRVDGKLSSRKGVAVSSRE